ncbi:hypothetical protein [Pseudobdellovibrio exovorus]|uniref:Uncharacterized protein n=1 Tax=Pseudobdellovibrio exovorus JSS TaxID=1184267 RepID=M4V744_9BACT|nr:hypothetical protein [Pseudobdellovibrio exovorus]AGH95008.1 hypothetical protein A11Q_790 [Pseudobdellovibrio exovorus JSS]
MSEDKKIKIPTGQLELGETRLKEPDRNYHRGGRSFYFFDFDDNIAFLSTSLVLFHKQTGDELFLSSSEWALHHAYIGKSGPYVEYEIRYDDETGSFRNFRDLDLNEVEKLDGKKQLFVQDVQKALGLPDLQWKGPSWNCFYHAAFNQRPVSVITARGHSAATIQEGVREFIRSGYLPVEPNYLSVYAVSNKKVRAHLGDVEGNASIAELKQRAIRASVEKAIEVYGYSPHHRFGMSDDDPKNIQLVVEEMTRLKSVYPQMSFFMIETHGGDFIKHEISQHGLKSHYMSDNESQLDLFNPTRRKT